MEKTCLQDECWLMVECHTTSARDWQLPTAHGVRSTISGLGSALHPDQKSKEQSIKDYWKIKVGLFDGKEMLNASEVTKRGLHKILSQLFEHSLSADQSRINSAYPDLTSGTAGYLKTGDQKIRDHYVRCCNHLLNN
ncbi:MAG: hypothetical protein ACK4QL_08580 [Pseudanabaenaceae cyanobacterium]